MRPINTADVIRACRLDQAELSAEAKRAAARAAFAAMTDAERRAVFDRINGPLERAAIRVNAAAIAVNGPRAELLFTGGQQPEQRSVPMTEAEMNAAGILRACPRCGAEARGMSDDQRADWFTSHYNARHGGYR